MLSLVLKMCLWDWWVSSSLFSSRPNSCEIQTESPYYLPTPSAPAPFDKVVGKFPGDPDFAECKGDKSCMISWGLRLVNSQGIFVVGAGLYSWFFDNYGQTCIEPMSCQKSLLSVDEPSTLSIYNLFTVGTKEMVSPKGGTTLLAKDNQMLIGKSPWTSTIASWTKQDSLNIVMHASNMWVVLFYIFYPDITIVRDC